MMYSVQVLGVCCFDGIGCQEMVYANGWPVWQEEF